MTWRHILVKNLTVTLRLKGGDPMATTSLWPIRNTGKRAVKMIVRQVVEYAENEEKTKHPSEQQEERITMMNPRETVQSVMSYVSDKNEGMKYVAGINCTAERAVEEMLITRLRWPERGNRILYHGYQSFLPGESNPEQVHRIGVEMAKELWGDRFEVVVATHLDRAHLHNHFVIHAVSFIDGRKFIWDEEFPRMQEKSDEICIREGLNIVPPDVDQQRSRKRGALYAEAMGVPTIESIVKEDVDACIQCASSLDDWVKLMEEKGYRILNTGKYVRVFPYGHGKCIRIDRRFGEDYSLDRIGERIANRGMETETAPVSDDETVQTIFEEFRKSEIQRRARHSGTGYKGKFYRRDPMIVTTGRIRFPLGIQLKYLRFIVRTGYRKTPKQIARIHYLYREELTRLDRYIAEAKYLIYENIQSENDLLARKEELEARVFDASREKRRILYRIMEHPEEAARLRPDLSYIREEVRVCKKDLEHCRNILERMETMQRKERMVHQIEENPESADVKKWHQKENMEEIKNEESQL